MECTSSNTKQFYPPEFQNEWLQTEPNTRMHTDLFYQYDSPINTHRCCICAPVSWIVIVLFSTHSHCLALISPNNSWLIFNCTLRIYSNELRLEEYIYFFLWENSIWTYCQLKIVHFDWVWICHTCRSSGDAKYRVISRYGVDLVSSEFT